MSENRLDALVDTLRRTEPILDDVTRARVGANLQAALRDPSLADGATGAGLLAGRRARWIPLAGLAAAAAAAAVFVWTRDAGTAHVAGQNGDTAASASANTAAETATAATPALPILAPGGALDVVAGATARVTVAAADVTIYGPGRITADVTTAGDVPTAIVDADAALVDRSTGDGTWTLRYGAFDVRVTHATFALDRKITPRVTVLRGELLLICGADERIVRAGETATCAPVQTASNDHASAPARSAPPSSPPSAPRAPSIAPARSQAAPPRAPAIVAASPAGSAPRSEAADGYAIADEAMRRGDRTAARAALQALVAARPDATDAAAALLDLARLDAADRDHAAALRHLDALAAHPDAGRLAEPAAHLRCTVVPERDRAACLAAYYRAHPDSPRAAPVLARLATELAATDCAAAAPLLTEYLARFPTARDAAAVTAWRDRCAER